MILWGYRWSLWKIWNIVLKLHKQIFTFKLNSQLIFLTTFLINSQFEAHGVAVYNLKWPFIDCLIREGRAAYTNSDPVFHLHSVVDKPWILTLAKIRLPVLLKMPIRHWSDAVIVPFKHWCMETWSAFITLKHQYIQSCILLTLDMSLSNITQCRIQHDNDI